MKHQRTYRNRLVHVALGAKVAHGAAIQAAPHRFQFLDDLHGPHLGCTNQRAGRKCRGEQVEGVAPGCQFAAHTADHVHHMAVALDRTVRLDPHAAGTGDAAQVIARQVHQHHVLGVFLAVGAQLGFQPRVELRLIGPRPGAGDRPQLRLAAVEFHQRFGRGADHGQVAQAAEIHIRGWVDQPQRAVDLERIECMTAGETR